MTLPVFEIERVEVQDNGSYSMYIVTCPRKGCRGEFWVPLKWSVLHAVEGAGGQMRVPLGRPCPHCAMAAEVPEDIRRIVMTKRRRIVRRRKKVAT